MSKSITIRERYEATCLGYDELYRSEQYEKYFVALKRVKPRGVVLDAGCGTGLLVEFLYSWKLLDDISLYICLDYSGCMTSIANWKLKVLCNGKCQATIGDVENIPLADKSVDVTYSFTVLDLLDDPFRGLEEMVRVTRGDIIVSVLKSLHLKDNLIGKYSLIGSTSKDLIFNIREMV
ncbi:MAG: class I SAM-dependent methyltransferase [Acidilobaceae archaeon]